MTATDILLFRTLAAARQEGLPEPLAFAGGTPTGGEPSLCLNLETEQDVARWEAWLIRHSVADSDWTNEGGSGVYRVRVGHWRGWRIELVHLVPVGLEAGVAGE